jgi:hypothetical protein
MSVRTFAVGVVGLALLAPGAALGQMKAPETQPAKFSMSKEYRAVQASALKSQRKLMLSFADSMPEKLYRQRATPAQRDFAQQVFHIVSANGYLGQLFMTGAGPTSMPDTAAILNSRAGLKQFINDTYDKLDQLITTQTDADRDVQVKFFSGFIPRWQVWDELNQHAMWTAGQVVANFRQNGMAPPAFLFF